MATAANPAGGQEREPLGRLVPNYARSRLPFHDFYANITAPKTEVRKAVRIAKKLLCPPDHRWIELWDFVQRWGQELGTNVPFGCLHAYLFLDEFANAGLVEVAELHCDRFIFRPRGYLKLILKTQLEILDRQIEKEQLKQANGNDFLDRVENVHIWDE